jgi:hypothetical protein
MPITETAETTLIINSIEHSPSSKAAGHLAGQQLPTFHEKREFITVFTSAQH